MQPIDRTPLLHLVRDAIYPVLYHTRLSKLFYVLKGRRQGVISYHNVLPAASLPSGDRYRMDIPASVLEEHLSFLTGHFPVLPFAHKIATPAAKGFFISFDDGMLNNYEVLLPLLEKYRIKAMFAVCPALVSGRIPHLWQDHLFLLLRTLAGKTAKLPHDGYDVPVPVPPDQVDAVLKTVQDWVHRQQLSDVYGLVREMCRQNGVAYGQMDFDRLRFTGMTWDHITDLHQRGHTLASHTLTHRVMRYLSPDEKKRELADARQELEDHLKEHVPGVVYPYGGEKEVDQETVQMARRAGYQLGFMNVPHPPYDDPLALPRFGVPLIDDEPQLYAAVSGLTAYLKAGPV